MNNAAKTLVSVKNINSAQSNPAVKNKHGFLDDNTVWNSQAGSLIFCCGIVFKVSSLPGLVAQTLGSSTLWLYILMSCIDLVCLTATYLFAKSGADGFLSARKRLPYRMLNGLMSLYLLTKGFFYFVYTVIFLTIDLFVGVAPYVIILVLAVPVVYTGVKGIRALARSSELFAVVLFLIMIVNLAFLNADTDFGRNLPVFAVSPSDFFKEGLRYSLWLGDLFPLLFIKLRNKKLPFFGIGAGVSYILVLVVAMLAVAMYGNALPYVYNMLIRIAGFNQLSMEIGRLEWAALFVVIIMAICGLSLLFWGSAESCRRAVGTPVPARILFTLLITVLPLALPTLQDVVTFSTTDFGYAMFAFALFFAFAYGVAAIYAKRKMPKTPLSSDIPLSGTSSCGNTTADDKQTDALQNEQSAGLSGNVSDDGISASKSSSGENAANITSGGENND